MLFKQKHYITPDLHDIDHSEPANNTVPAGYCIATKDFLERSGALLSVAGTENGAPFYIDLASMPHTLIAGATGSGKSVMVNSIICSLLCKYSPSQLGLIMIDTKRVELTPYDGIKHLLFPVATEPDRAQLLLRWACKEMETRYSVMQRERVRTYKGLWPPLLIVIEELADLMLDRTHRKEIERLIVRIAQLGRAAGIHLLLATQRPSVDVVTGLIKANVPGRICMAVASYRDSMIMLDRKGAEELNGRGDCLIQIPGERMLHRVQGAYIADKDIDTIATHWRDKRRHIVKI